MSHKVKYGAVALVVIFASLFFLTTCSKTKLDPPQTPKVNVDKLEQLQIKAFDFQKEKKWCEAKKVWEEVHNLASNTLPSDTKTKTTWEQKALGNLQMLNELCQPEEELVPKVSEQAFPKLPVGKRPEAISKDQLLKYYPAGRTIKSAGILNITGRGTDEDWGIHGEAHFTYFSRVEMNSKVVNNNGTRAIFEVNFVKVDQTRVVGKKEFQLAEIDSPLLIVAGVIADRAMSNSPMFQPYYTAAKVVGGVVLMADPDLKQSLTWLGNVVDLSAGEDLEITSKIEKLSGSTFEMAYVSGMGVVSITDKASEKKDENPLFSKAELVSLAYQSSLLMDYFILPEKKREGEEWNIRAEDVGNLLSIGYDTSMTGTIRLKRGADIVRKTENNKAEKNALLDVVRGDVYVQGDVDGGDQSAKMTVKTGRIYYLEKDLLTRKAEMEFNANSMWQSKTSLLFGAKKIRDLGVKAMYESEEILSRK